MIGTLAARAAAGRRAADTGVGACRDPLQARLFERHGIEVPIMPLARAAAPARPHLGAALQRAEQYERLADALRKELAAERG